MIAMSAAVIVIFAGIYLVCLAAVALVVPQKAIRFFGGFATSARVHFLELGVRTLVGISLLAYAPHMAFGSGFRVFGWILALSSVLLAVVPWRWHQRFAQATVPHATRYPFVLALGSFVLGVGILAAVVKGS